ncbi:hypothetical protein JVX90_10375 [Gordonia sp. PDNC005]|uniref:hypothetical protein n=1 Tax=unclassified Gordonia (in: high G+C Gram-positive bacteria) TaxID=2657482 RepID=UPI001966B03D|nr:hypothetical protein [Gordonia sp. PDNC005]QRY60870.1 hypothetical protein JVX90_10375 [Gordonia sp. PDNC005]
MPANERDTRAGAAPSGDPVQDMLLGLVSNIDQLAAIIGGGHSAAAAAVGVVPGPIPELAAELGTLLAELGDLLARILSAVIAILEAIAESLRSAPAGQPAPSSGFESIPVRISDSGA